jgi:ammonia channel protein AmtB
VKEIRRSGSASAFNMTLMFVLFNVLFLTTTTALIAISDFNRYRFKINAFYLLLLGMLMTSAVHGITHTKETDKPGRKSASREHLGEDH